MNNGETNIFVNGELTMSTTTQGRIGKGNAAFAAMTRGQRAVAVARDALRLLEAGRIVEQRGTYVALGVSNEDDYRVAEGASLRSVLPNYECHVCAMGALFVGAIDKFNGVQATGTELRDCIYKFNSGNTIVHHLAQVFTPRQLRLIEAAFETYRWGGDMIPTEAEMDGIQRYTDVHPNRRQRLEAILANIVRNKGTFVCTAAEAAVPLKPPAKRKATAK